LIRETSKTTSALKFYIDSNEQSEWHLKMPERSLLRLYAT